MLKSLPARLVLILLVCVAIYQLELFLNGKVLAKELSGYTVRVIMLSGIAVIMAVSLNLVNGVTGQFSIGHAGFMALGAYAGAAFTVYGQHRFLPPITRETPELTRHLVLLASLLIGGGVAAAAGWLVGLPSLRLRGDYLAIVTLGFGEIIRVAILNIEAVGGAAGFGGVRTEANYVAIPGLTTFSSVFILVAAVLVFCRNLQYSPRGLTFLAVREDEIAAEAMGVPTTRVKVTAFVISAFFAGVAGSLFAHYDVYLKPDSFNFLRSIEIVTMVVLGGMGSISGSVLGAIILVVAPEWLRAWLPVLQKRGMLSDTVSPDLVRQLLYSMLLVVLMLIRPQGLFGDREVSARGLLTWASAWRRKSG